MNWYFYMGLVVFIEFVVEYFAKLYSIEQQIWQFVVCLLGFMATSVFWLLMLKEGVGLGRAAVLYSVGTVLMAIIIEGGLFGETYSWQKWFGFTLGLGSLSLLIGDSE